MKSWPNIATRLKAIAKAYVCRFSDLPKPKAKEKLALQIHVILLENTERHLTYHKFTAVDTRAKIWV